MNILKYIEYCIVNILQYWNRLNKTNCCFSDVKKHKHLKVLLYYIFQCIPVIFSSRN